ncbi:MULTISPECIES: pseudaminic acid cytidylyltransferase [Chromobacterium]|uniref:Pseudaminic acid cytidylyltransferase n=3 Tax=Chromobacterium TaxID=535 RepID=A0ABS3GML3_9NEIS|nr:MULTISPECIES: pseudaminic acid cytidylyltransferase [Chromobacterium]AXT48000.1 pseudaminic acid cytidylyltransferase [Chromobacterium rhizoryzae]MBK0415035.1 pseudaminic acid cytidylyltransferase [Chromobacterium haemolyticum]MBO0416295.1 pseudaminic acid cytidylyltransferase [Chromobacterium haemolyticum]MBO0499673.1 pseudaminic acid cytidylyltransferase [Chromobacterium haemolyticum]MDH0342389.1 pseudaminic acid cytidylyltransferase [Chromobacterium haemolyticum]
MSRSVAVIPARGGSKRIPGKNIKPFHGLPLIAYSIRTAQACGLFSRIIVSTDDDQIAQVARQYGADVPFVRPRELSDDYTTTVAVIRHAVAFLQEQGEVFDYACCLYATAPLMQASCLRRGLNLLEMDAGKHYAVSVTSFGFPVQRALKISSEGNLVPMYPQYRDTRSQDLEESFQDAGQFYWGRRQAWLECEPFFSERSLAVRLPRHLVQDIDTEEDWRRAEWMYAVLQAAGEAT